MSREQLNEFFSNLKDRSISVKEDFTCCKTCGAAEILSFQRNSDMGYCFYHNQSTEEAAKTGELYLYWGAYSEEEIDEIIIANAIVDEAQACKIDVKWNGFASDAIHLFNLDKSYFQDKSRRINIIYKMPDI